jgi:uncharacterized membrane protein
LTPEPQQSQNTRRRRRGLLRAPLVHIERTLGAGILVILPIGITVVILKFFFDLLDPVLQPVVDLLPGRDIPGLGFLALMLLIYLAGLITTHVLGRRVIDLGHRVLEVIPVVKSIYGTTRTAVEMLSGNTGDNYSGVVLIDFPRPGTRAIGLVTSRMFDTNGEETLAVYIPTTPIPSSGFLVIARASEVTPTDMSVEDAMKVVISGGILTAQVFQRFGVAVDQTVRSNQ